MKKRSYSGLQSDLAAANMECRNYMDQVIQLKKDKEGDIRAVEQRYARQAANMAVLIRHLADMLAETSNRVGQ